MSTSPPSATPAPPRPEDNEREIKIVSHSNLFYWWPVWAVGLLMGLLTLFDGGQLAIVPSGTTASRVVQVQTEAGPPAKYEAREALIVPGGKHLPPSKEVNGHLPDPDKPKLDMAASGAFGVIFLITLLLVITITNVPLRGMWSVVVIVTLILGVIILCLAPWGERHGDGRPD